MKKGLFLLGFSLLLFNSCTKEQSTLPITKENIAGTYELKEIWMSATGVPEQDAYPNMRACGKDNLYHFNADYSFNYVDAGIICDVNETFLGAWELNDTLITFMGQTGSITRFNEKHMEVTVEVQDANTETTFTTRYGFKKL